MYCQNCSSVIAQGATFCSLCGTRVGAGQSNPNPFAAQQQVPAKPSFSGYQTPPQTSGLAIAAIVSTFIIPLLGLIFGYLARKEIRSSMGQKTGDGMATASIIISWIFVGLSALFVVIAIMAAASSSYY